MTPQRRSDAWQRDFKRTTSPLHSDGELIRIAVDTPEGVDNALRQRAKNLMRDAHYRSWPITLRRIVDAGLRLASEECSKSCSSLVQEKASARERCATATSLEEHHAAYDRLDEIRKSALDVAFAFSRALFVLSFRVWNFLYALARKRPERNPRLIAAIVAMVAYFGKTAPGQWACDLPETGPPRIYRFVARLENRAPPTAPQLHGQVRGYAWVPSRGILAIA